MRVLVCAEEAPLPPMNGFRSAVASLIEHLRPANEVRVLAYRRPDQEAAALDDMRLLSRPDSRPGEKAKLFSRAIARRRPLRTDALADGMAPALAEELERFRPHVVHVTAGRLAGLAGILGGRATVLAALDAPHLNVEARAEQAPVLMRGLLRGEAERLRRFEAEEWHRFGSVVVVSEEDADALRSIDARMALVVIPGGIDPAPYVPRPGVARNPDRLMFHGVLDYAPNVAAADFLARDILPIVRARRPGAHLVLVGRSPAPEARALAALDGVTLLADVPDVAEQLSSATVYVCPMRSGTGVKNKLLEAMANGLACVATPLAVRGLDAVPERDVLIGRTSDEIASHVVRVLEAPAIASSLGAAGSNYVASAHDWSVIAHAYETLYRRLSDASLRRSAERR
jgi:glycosyltransferase involved in cell wall biosynthesis